MKRLRFDKSGVEMRRAAMILATSQSPWATYVQCSKADYCSLRFHFLNGPEYHMDVVKDLVCFAGDLETGISNDANFHRIIVRPSADVWEGWVELL